jgi:hypothetical protein
MKENKTDGTEKHVRLTPQEELLAATWRAIDRMPLTDNCRMIRDYVAVEVQKKGLPGLVQCLRKLTRTEGIEFHEPVRNFEPVFDNAQKISRREAMGHIGIRGGAILVAAGALIPTSGHIFRQIRRSKTRSETENNSLQNIIGKQDALDVESSLALRSGLALTVSDIAKVLAFSGSASMAIGVANVAFIPDVDPQKYESGLYDLLMHIAAHYEDRKLSPTNTTVRSAR